MTFKIGDKVKRIHCDLETFKGMVVGDTDTITALGRVSLTLEEFGCGHTIANFELVEEPKPATTPHKWAKEIKAWADGAVLQYWNGGSRSDWQDVSNPFMYTDEYSHYRIKPEKKPDVVSTSKLTRNSDGLAIFPVGHAPWLPELGGLKLTFDGDTGKLKAVELINN